MTDPYSQECLDRAGLPLSNDLGWWPDSFEKLLSEDDPVEDEWCWDDSDSFGYYDDYLYFDDPYADDDWTIDDDMLLAEF